jgi:hypothetical protein
MDDLSGTGQAGPNPGLTRIVHRVGRDVRAEIELPLVVSQSLPGPRP